MDDVYLCIKLLSGIEKRQGVVFHKSDIFSPVVQIQMVYCRKILVNFCYFRGCLNSTLLSDVLHGLLSPRETQDVLKQHNSNYSVKVRDQKATAAHEKQSKDHVLERK